MLEIRKHYDLGSLIIIAITFILFMSAPFTKGFIHDILLEAAVFLVSIKLVIMAYKNVDATHSLHQKLDEMYKKIEAIESHQSRDGHDNT
ncbi:MAG: hypothetical protein DRJ11_10725 [Candidatus Aminicenantes bacterium]|nr:MAG: hypothetical protein DRJ11_10725 [Candidatus Aminicenantes bacterium]